MQAWLLLIYKVSPEPTARRVYIWRKLKRLGAILIHDSVWVLPPTPYTREQLQWLVAEIVEMEGEGMIWEAMLTSPEQDTALIQQFKTQSENAYSEILVELQHKDCDLAALSRRYQQIKMSDYFHSDMEQQVRQALIAAKGDSEL
jgi:hypothetical protein